MDEVSSVVVSIAPNSGMALVPAKKAKKPGLDVRHVPSLFKAILTGVPLCRYEVVMIKDVGKRPTRTTETMALSADGSVVKHGSDSDVKIFKSTDICSVALGLSKFPASLTRIRAHDKYSQCFSVLVSKSWYHFSCGSDDDAKLCVLMLSHFGSKLGHAVPMSKGLFYWRRCSVSLIETAVHQRSTPMSSLLHVLQQSQYCQKPILTPDGAMRRRFPCAVVVKVFCPTAVASLFYTLDGTTPTKESEPYDELEGIVLGCEGKHTVAVVAVYDKKKSVKGAQPLQDSDVVVSQFTVKLPSLAKVLQAGQLMYVHTANRDPKSARKTPYLRTPAFVALNRDLSHIIIMDEKKKKIAKRIACQILADVEFGASTDALRYASTRTDKPWCCMSVRTAEAEISMSVTEDHEDCLPPITVGFQAIIMLLRARSDNDEDVEKGKYTVSACRWIRVKQRIYFKGRGSGLTKNQTLALVLLEAADIRASFDQHATYVPFMNLMTGQHVLHDGQLEVRPSLVHYESFSVGHKDNLGSEHFKEYPFGLSKDKTLLKFGNKPSQKAGLHPFELKIEDCIGVVYGNDAFDPVYKVRNFHPPFASFSILTAKGTHSFSGVNADHVLRSFLGLSYLTSLSGQKYMFKRDLDVHLYDTLGAVLAEQMLELVEEEPLSIGYMLWARGKMRLQYMALEQQVQKRDVLLNLLTQYSRSCRRPQVHPKNGAFVMEPYMSSPELGYGDEVSTVQIRKLEVDITNYESGGSVYYTLDGSDCLEWGMKTHEQVGTVASFETKLGQAESHLCVLKDASASFIAINVELKKLYKKLDAISAVLDENRARIVEREQNLGEVLKHTTHQGSRDKAQNDLDTLMEEIPGLESELADASKALESYKLSILEQRAADAKALEAGAANNMNEADGAVEAARQARAASMAPGQRTLDRQTVTDAETLFKALQGRHETLQEATAVAVVNAEKVDWPASEDPHGVNEAVTKIRFDLMKTDIQTAEQQVTTLRTKLIEAKAVLADINKTCKVYTVPFEITEAGKYKLSSICIKTGKAPSEPNIVYYNVHPFTTPTPNFRAFGQSGNCYDTSNTIDRTKRFLNPVRVTMWVASDIAKIHFTEDGTVPTRSSPIFDTTKTFKWDAMGVGQKLALMASIPGCIDSQMVSGVFDIDKDTVQTPMISPPQGEHTSPVEVRINCATTDAMVHYTEDGSEPTQYSPVWEPGSFKEYTQKGSIVLKARGWRDFFETSDIAEAPLTVLNKKVTQCVIFPQGGIHQAPLQIEVTCPDTPSAIIHYTVTGEDECHEDPDAESPVWKYEWLTNSRTTADHTTNSEIVIPWKKPGKWTYSAVACKDGWRSSEIAVFDFEILEGTVETPVILPPPGAYAVPMAITISCATFGSRIYFTITDPLKPGGKPDPRTSEEYFNTIRVQSQGKRKIQARSFSEHMRDSEIADITYDHTIPDYHIQVTIHLSEALADGMMVMQVVVPESWMVIELKDFLSDNWPELEANSHTNRMVMAGRVLNNAKPLKSYHTGISFVLFLENASFEKQFQAQNSLVQY